MVLNTTSKGDTLSLLGLIVTTLFTFQIKAKPHSATDLKKMAEQEISVPSAKNKKSQTVKIKAPEPIQKSQRPNSHWSLGYQLVQLEPVRFQVKSVSLKTPSISQSQLLFVKARTPIYQLLNDRYLFLTGSFSYGRDNTEFQSISKFQDGYIEIFHPTVGLSFEFFNTARFHFSFETAYAVYLYNIKNQDSNFQQTANAQSLQNSITTYWDLFDNAGLELSISRESLLSGDFEPVNSLKLGYRGEF